MIIRPTVQSSAPPGRPDIIEPVLATPDVPLFYLREIGRPVAWPHAVLCSRMFAETILTTLNDLMGWWHFAFVHLGFYDPRKARRRDGTPITPERWSTHAYAEAVDWAGVITQDGRGQYLDMEAFRVGAPAKYGAVITQVRAAIQTLHRRAEIVQEGHWEHLGMFPR